MKITIEIDDNKTSILTNHVVDHDEKPAKTEDDDHIRFGDVVGFKTHAGDITTGLVINIQDGKADILYKTVYDDCLHLTRNLLEDLKRLEITYSEITEDIMEWLAN